MAAKMLLKPHKMHNFIQKTYQRDGKVLPMWKKNAIVSLALTDPFMCQRDVFMQKIVDLVIFKDRPKVKFVLTIDSYCDL